MPELKFINEESVEFDNYLLSTEQLQSKNQRPSRFESSCLNYFNDDELIGNQNQQDQIEMRPGPSNEGIESVSREAIENAYFEQNFIKHFSELQNLEDNNKYSDTSQSDELTKDFSINYHAKSDLSSIQCQSSIISKKGYQILEQENSNSEKPQTDFYFYTQIISLNSMIII
ncbi:UNKNOWN [Stylonychia lemnae]|uniref:Uncharacterized protein n=1 Tax=Stylonychia lemnae TaxID=5949 RepID=A0A077ZXJ3_STYLE|nr:UNKNOWN [Stylonychia lemnae]|eukprot:CDW74281.1 UNKNOWN [Stylonychia lemnae]